MKEQYLWTEKYRPDTLDTYIGNESLKSKVGKFIATGDVPHLLLNGPAGTGKTTVAKIIAKSIDCDVMYINASDENNIDTVRNKIKSFASSVGFRDLKIIILDEADFITPNAQAALRNIMETFSSHCRFILTCNYVESIIPAVISRTQQFHVVPPSKVDVAKHVAGILKKENVTYELTDVKLLVDAHYPDIRKIINELQLNTDNNVLSIDAEEVVMSDVKLRILELLSQKGDAKKRFTEARQLIADAGIKNFTDFYALLFEKIDTFAQGHISQVILAVNEGQKWDSQVVNKEINFMSTLISIFQIVG